jgi:hypothetical protein
VKISPKGMLIGGIVDILSSSFLGIPFAIYAVSKVDKAQLANDHLGSAIAAVSHTRLWLYGAQLLVGISCSVLGGYVAALLAKHDYLLNGAFSSFLCVTIGIYSIASGKNSPHAHWVQILTLISAPLCGFFGGYLRLRRHVPAVAVCR